MYFLANFFDSNKMSKFGYHNKNQLKPQLHFKYSKYLINFCCEIQIYIEKIYKKMEEIEYKLSNSFDKKCPHILLLRKDLRCGQFISGDDLNAPSNLLSSSNQKLRQQDKISLRIKDLFLNKNVQKRHVGLI
ncbi:hypothetical protein BpHYR1_038384 [Brachionus plicatilis]|uniref:Uncharacterized protein n=1 Tax=Brachionus plicatilis TaxID=10195 RepID=A0A3M7RR13_BRAPC|nr:hypothetical protein BpHYR1_038384 [Brachionus plicatilis]